MTTWPYCPLPPDCRMNLPSTFSTRLRIVSRIRDLRPTDVRVDLELAHHAVDDDLEVQLAHARDDRLARLLVRVDAERRIFLRQLRQRDAELVLIRLRLRLDRDVDDGIRELHRLEDDRMIIVAHRVAGARVLEADRGGDVAGAHFLDLLALVRVHLQQAADALALVLRRVVDVRARLEHARVHAEERQLSDERIGRDLERERRERRVVRRPARSTCARRGAAGAPRSAARRPAPAGSRSPRRAAPARPCS